MKAKSKPPVVERSAAELRESAKSIRIRLQRCCRPNSPRVKPPAEVVAAQKIIHKWKGQTERKYETACKAWRARVTAVDNALILGDIPQALELLLALEKESGK